MAFEYTDQLEKIGRMRDGYYDAERKATLYTNSRGRSYHRNILFYEYEGQEKSMNISVFHDDLERGQFSISLHGNERFSLSQKEKKYILELIRDSVSLDLQESYGSLNPTFDINKISI